MIATAGPAVASAPRAGATVEGSSDCPASTSTSAAFVVANRSEGPTSVRWSVVGRAGSTRLDLDSYESGSIVVPTTPGSGLVRLDLSVAGNRVQRVRECRHPGTDGSTRPPLLPAPGPVPAVRVGSELPGEPSVVTGLRPSLSDDGDLVVYDDGGRAYLRNLFGHVATYSVADSGVAADLASQGDFVAYQSGDDVYVFDRGSATSRLVSHDPTGHPVGGFAPSVSADGRFVAFTSSSEHLVPGDGYASYDVFVWDGDSDTVSLVSATPAGGVTGDPGSPSDKPAISDDGRYVAFHSVASDLVAGDTDNVPDVFVRDLVTGTTTLGSVGPRGARSDGDSTDPSLSGNGRYLAFASDARTFAGANAEHRYEVYLRDLVTGTTRLLSAGPYGGAVDGASVTPVVSQNGQTVAYASTARQLLAGNPVGTSQVYAYDRVTGMTRRVSQGAVGAGDGDSTSPAVSALGDVVAYATDARNLAPEPGTGFRWPRVLVATLR